MEYVPIQVLSDKWNISKRRIQILCKTGRIEGATMIGNMWVAPNDAIRPADARTKSPTKNINIGEGSFVRKELKKLLKDLYKIANDIRGDEAKDLILTAIAIGLCEHYIGFEAATPEIRKKISKDLTGKVVDNICEKISNRVCEFIKQYENDPELNNILSWAYQYSNKLVKGNIYSQTQFFTEKYMIEYLVASIANIERSNKIVDPCAGGGNFLVESLEALCNSIDGDEKDFTDGIIANTRKLYCYDIDCNITKVALVNIRLRALAILKQKFGVATFDIWNDIKPHVYMSKSTDKVRGSLATDKYTVVDILSGEEMPILTALGDADVILTNPPFATIKGMNQEQKNFLKEYYPDSNCDMCVSYFDAIYKLLKPFGYCGIVSQNAWMFLKSFKKIRERITTTYKIIKIANLGAGAFLDLSGEKSNVALLTIKKEIPVGNVIEILDLAECSLPKKKEALWKDDNSIYIMQEDINGINGYDFCEKGTLKKLLSFPKVYRDIAVPMQGTSTGNAKELVAFFWEHFGDEEWINVSNGGGYCRWQGLNDSVVKWGTNGEYIKAQKGSALRNIRYFSETKMVFSDTGTAGLNVRLLLGDQIFIASGPGIRISEGSTYAHLALLNSRLAAYCVKMMSPKITIAAGYIGQIPITQNICSSVVLEKNAKLCIELKQKVLSTRPNNLEYNSLYLSQVPEQLEVAAWVMFNDDITNELLKLQIENKIDNFIFKEYGISEEDQEQLEKTIGKSAYEINEVTDVDIYKLDMYMEKLLDASCCLKRTRVSKNTLGCDGIVEYVSKDLRINPEVIVEKIQESPYSMKKVLSKYEGLIMHNMILEFFGYNTKTGISKQLCLIEEAGAFLNGKFKGEINGVSWIKSFFNSIHTEIFKGKPCLIYESGVIQRYENKTTG